MRTLKTKRFIDKNLIYLKERHGNKSTKKVLSKWDNVAWLCRYGFPLQTSTFDDEDAVMALGFYVWIYTGCGYDSVHANYKCDDDYELICIKQENRFASNRMRIKKRKNNNFTVRTDNSYQFNNLSFGSW